jgi:hypothetical protein
VTKKGVILKIKLDQIGENVMRTQAEVKASQTSQTPSRIYKSIWPYALAVLLAVFVVGAVILLSPPQEALSASNQSAMDASAARYQGLADMYAGDQAALERGWQASADRHQGLADLQAKQALSPAQAAMAARYQGLADMYAGDQAALERGWQASADRYQGLADLQAKQALSPAQAAMAARYQGLADMHAENIAALERGWQASAARYQGLAELQDLGK